MSYRIILTENAEEGLEKLEKNDPEAYKKVNELIGELMDHPKVGEGKPEELRNIMDGEWSRRISEKHRLVYNVSDKQMAVKILSTYGHYNDK